jgi:Uma2 family endonuclease
VEQYHEMIEQGILPEDPAVELLDGQLVQKDRSHVGADPMTIGHSHQWAIDNLADLLSDLKTKEHYLRTQAPISIRPDNEPEPDGAIVRGMPNNYRERHPGPADIICVIEVADSSLHRDRTTKLRIYADAGIVRYLIINLIDMTIEDYREPMTGSGRYAISDVLRKGQRLSIPLASQSPLELTVDQLLP